MIVSNVAIRLAAVGLRRRRASCQPSVVCPRARRRNADRLDSLSRFRLHMANSAARFALRRTAAVSVAPRQCADRPKISWYVPVFHALRRKVGMVVKYTVTRTNARQDRNGCRRWLAERSDAGLGCVGLPEGGIRGLSPNAPSWRRAATKRWRYPKRWFPRSRPGTMPHWERRLSVGPPPSGG